MFSLALVAGAPGAALAQTANPPGASASLREGYSIRVPAAMMQIPNSVSLQRNSNVVVHTFAGWLNRDHTGAKLVYGLLRLPKPPSSGLPPLSETTSFFLKTQIAPHYRGFTVESKSTVRLAGLIFDKVAFHGRCAGIANPEQGFVYLAYDGARQLVMILGDDEEPYSGVVLPVLNGAALTLTAPSQAAASDTMYQAQVPASAPDAAPQTDFSHAAPHAFTAGAEATAQLARVRTLVCGAQYSLRLPRGYVPYSVLSLPVPAGRQLSAFRSINPDSTHPVIVVFTADVAPAMRNPKDVAVMMSAAVQEIAQQEKLELRQYRQFPVERGTVGDVSYNRVQYQGITATKSTTGSPAAHGFVYVGYDRGTLVCIFAENFAPYSVQTLPLQEASALSLTRE